MQRPYSEAANRNKDPIFNILKNYITDGHLLEVGTGTAQHAEFLASKLPQCKWHISEHKDNYPLLSSFVDQLEPKNILGHYRLTIGEDDFPKIPFDYVYTANTLHIMSWKEVKSFVKLVGKRLREGSLLFIYGPFKYNDEFTSESNNSFDKVLKLQNAQSGIRDFEKVKDQLQKVGFKLLKDEPMPANNQLLIFEKLKF